VTLDDVVNIELLKSPMNWVVVWFITLIWLLAIHTFLHGWGPTQSMFNNGPLPNGTSLPPSTASAIGMEAIFGGIPQ